MANKLLNLKPKIQIDKAFNVSRRSFKHYDANSCKGTGLYGSVYDFSVDYSAITNDEILDIHKYLMKKNNIV